MTNRTANRLGQLYRLLCKACGEGKNGRPANAADLDNATRWPLRAVSLKITRAHQLHKMSNDLNKMCASVLADCTLEEMEDSFALKALPIGQQGAFMIGYQTADAENLLKEE